jgi:uncharacterized protein YdhG (YjbR/CyaY superfamily)
LGRRSELPSPKRDDRRGELMKSRKPGLGSIDEYIDAFPEDMQKTLRGLRSTIRASAPDAEEKISYQIPTFTLKGNLVHFAAYQKHIGFYPTSSGIRAFKRELAAYELSKGTVRFPIDKPLPLKLISKIVKYRVAENLKNAEIRSRIRK